MDINMVIQNSRNTTARNLDKMSRYINPKVIRSIEKDREYQAKIFSDHIRSIVYGS